MVELFSVFFILTDTYRHSPSTELEDLISLKRRHPIIEDSISQYTYALTTDKKEVLIELTLNKINLLKPLIVQRLKDLGHYDKILPSLITLFNSNASSFLFNFFC